MSNCIEFGDADGIVVADFDMEAWNKLAPVRHYHATTDTEKFEDFKYWYADENTSFEDGCFCVKLGRGRSSHTWRDLDGLCWVLGHFTTAHQFCRVKIHDTGYEKVNYYAYYLWINPKHTWYKDESGQYPVNTLTLTPVQMGHLRRVLP